MPDVPRSQRLVVEPKEGHADSIAKGLKAKAKQLGIDVEDIVGRKVYAVASERRLNSSELGNIARGLTVNPITHKLVSNSDDVSAKNASYIIEVRFKPGVKDNEGDTAANEVARMLHLRREETHVFTSVQLLIFGAITQEQVDMLVKELHSNSVINEVRVRTPNIPLRPFLDAPESRLVVGKEDNSLLPVNLNVSDEELMKINSDLFLAMYPEHIQYVRDEFRKAEVQEKRKAAGLPQELWDKPSMLELKGFSAVNSEHCGHHVMKANITYTHADGTVEVIPGLFPTCIKGPSMQLVQQQCHYIRSDMTDNGGIMKVDEFTYVVFKKESHHGPTEIVPYGGANTCDGGCKRDDLATGKGAYIIGTTYVYIFGDPFSTPPDPDLIHPRVVREGVHAGMSSYGNKSGTPLMVPIERYVKECAGRVQIWGANYGTMPTEINGKDTAVKKAEVGDLMVVVGGRTGKDGIGGAVLASATMGKESQAGAVQIGDEMTQRDVWDFQMVARNKDLINDVNDFGAAGFISAFVEIARKTGGCKMDLKKAPLKYQGLKPWEVFISESQERMAFAVSPDKVRRFLRIAKSMGVEATVIGEFTDTGMMHVTYGDTTHAYLDMDFVFKNVPRLELEAREVIRKHDEPDFEQPQKMGEAFERMLTRLNIASKEYRIRQYDHEVQGRSVVKPLVGKDLDMPSDAAVALLHPEKDRTGIVIAIGVNPEYSRIHAGTSAYLAMDEALRRIVSTVGMPVIRAAMDNISCGFSDLRSEDGKERLGELVELCRAVEKFVNDYTTPCASGKDSIKNSWAITVKDQDGNPIIENGKPVKKLIQIPTTLVFSIVAKVDDVSKAITPPAKKAGDLVYIVGETRDELGASEYFAMMGETLKGEAFIGNGIPTPNVAADKVTYAAMNAANEKELLASSHTPTDGGLGVAAWMVAAGGNLGMQVDLRKVPYKGYGRSDYLLFSQTNGRFIVTIPPEQREEFEKTMHGTSFAQIGEITQEPSFVVTGLDGQELMNLSVPLTKEKWKEKLRGV